MAKLPSITVTLPVARSLAERGVKLKVATLYQTMGPHWREIIWTKTGNVRRCYVSDTHTIKQIRAMLS